MTVTIREGYDKSYYILSTKNKAFQKRYGQYLKVPASNLFDAMSEITTWANNELGEEMLFEVE